MIPADIEQNLFETRVKHITDKQFFDFAVKEYVTVALGDTIMVQFTDKEKLHLMPCNYAIPILQYYWINDYNGQKWQNQVQEYLGIFKIDKQRSYLVDSIDINSNKVSFHEFHHLGFSRSGIDTKISWADESEPYGYQINALRMSGTYDLSLVLTIAKNCCNTWEARSFAKFGYDHSNHRSWQDSVLIAKSELENFKQKIVSLIER